MTLTESGIRAWQKECLHDPSTEFFCIRENTMPKQPFWFFLTWISILWYAYLVFHVGWKGLHDIRRMIRDLESERKG